MTRPSAPAWISAACAALVVTIALKGCVTQDAVDLTDVQRRTQVIEARQDQYDARQRQAEREAQARLDRVEKAQHALQVEIADRLARIETKIDRAQER